MHVRYNFNPYNNRVGDCTVRAIGKVTGQPWDDIYWALCVQGFIVKDMPDSNEVWSSYLFNHGFRRFVIPNTCPNCYTVRDFCQEHPRGRYILATGTHVIAVIDGDYYDTWDSGDEVPIYYWRKE